LDVFINTHPHTIYHAIGATGIKDIYDEVSISEVWHSGHKPSKDHDSAYKDLEDIIKGVGQKNTFQLLGSNEENKLEKEIHPIGDITYNVLSPAEYVVEEIKNEKPQARDKRIHEQCGVIRFGYGSDPAYFNNW
jgi:competence protein ComEC